MGKNLDTSLKPKNENKIILKQWVQLFIVIIALVLFGISMWFVVKGLNKEAGPRKELYSYNYNSKLDYKVFLKPNSFFTGDSIGMNKQYISSLIDHIDVNPKYTFSSSKKLDYIYTYDVVAKVKGLYSEADGKANEIWSKEYSISPIETKSGSGSTFTIDKNVSVDYNKFNQIMNDFRNKFGLSIDAQVDVILRINIQAGLMGQEKTYNDKNSIALQIPLLSQTVKLTSDFVNSGHDVVYAPQKVNDSNISLKELIIGIVLFIVSILMFIHFGRMLLRTTKKSEYVLNLNKLLKEYGDIMAESDNVPDLTRYDVVNIKLFNDLVDIEEELHSPIIYTEIRENLESWFMVFTNDTAYRYVLKYEDLDHFSS